ncbi:facilitated trehalose transporter Tret1-2 homolog [Schistocerca nitens]|uniref:facilitated trehalose transporter Tret1-2 homolog n=1 Tax=Schistocerca nitens TaxID=7011 RepID=UPI002119264C|nr:facilitated trehalose transporter Tret1-2 homolog [Schistocerca nitens]
MTSGLFRADYSLVMLVPVVAGRVNLATVSAGAVMAWSSPALPLLPGLGGAQASWVGSLPSLGAALGPWLGGWAADRAGRRTAALLSALPLAASWVALLFVRQRPLWLCAVRFFSGIGVGLVYAVLPIYSAEIAQADVRGALGSLMQTSITVGFMIDYCAGPFVSYTTLAAIGLATPLLFVACFVWMPESPYYLLAVGEEAAAERALRWLRDVNRDVIFELREIKKAVEESRLSEGSLLAVFRTRRSRRALAISLGVVCAEQLAGINAVLFYTQSIFDAAGGDVDSRVAPIIVSGVMLLVSCLVPFLVDRLGRKFLLIFSSTGMSLALAVFGAFFYLSEAGHNTEDIGWLPLTALVFYIFVYTPGYGGLPFTVAGEVFAPNLKAVAMPMAAFVSWFMSFLVTRFFGDITDALGNYGAFFVFSLCALLASLYVYFFVPETNGKTLEEIQIMLENG